MLAAVLLALAQPPAPDVFAPANRVAWCVVPFDARQRGPADRVAMLTALGFTRFAYDWRAEHLPAFDYEVKLLKAAGIELTAVWFPANLGADARTLLAVVAKYEVRPQLWVTLPDPLGADQAARVAVAAAVIRPIAVEAAKLGCQVGLYNHGGWFGEPENQMAVIEALKLPNVGVVYNLHHGHAHLDRFPKVLEMLKPHLLCLNLNGMTPGGDKVGRKILPVGAGPADETVLRAIRAGGYAGPVGILGHTDHDAADRLADNLDGLAWVLAKLAGKPLPAPKWRTHKE